ncbi:hypothetical protein JB92DRAFT_3133300 [Gautieria morchelliformis]|nr:hypothetical protein JB92DRAFT_3133300 [Gautieria morchelliformis]
MPAPHGARGVYEAREADGVHPRDGEAELAADAAEELLGRACVAVAVVEELEALAAVQRLQRLEHEAVVRRRREGVEVRHDGGVRDVLPGTDARGVSDGRGRRERCGAHAYDLHLAHEAEASAVDHLDGDHALRLVVVVAVGDVRPRGVGVPLRVCEGGASGQARAEPVHGPPSAGLRFSVKMLRLGTGGCAPLRIVTSVRGARGWLTGLGAAGRRGPTPAADGRSAAGLHTTLVLVLEDAAAGVDADADTRAGACEVGFWVREGPGGEVESPYGS